MFQEIYAKALSIWEKPRCYACFEDDADVNAEMTLKNLTVKFFRRMNAYSACRDQFYHNTSEICVQCRSAYDKIKKFVTKHYEAGGESTCSDVSDLWNKTQRQWSVHFRCHVVPKDTFLLGAFTSVIFLLPVIFYISMYINSEVKRQSIDRMKRASESAVMSDTEMEDDHDTL